MKAFPDSDIKFEKLRRQAEELIRHGKDVDNVPPADMLELIQELKVHQVELQIQNEELKRAQQEISQLHRDYERLYEFAPCGYVTLNARGIITRVNLSGVKLLGAPRKHLLNSGLNLYISKEWQSAYLATRKRAGETGENQSMELVLKRANEPSLWVRADIQADRNDNDEVFQWRVILMNIDLEKEAKIALLQSEKQLIASLAVKESLLKEIHHRVKNNMQVITSLISLQTDGVEDHKITDIFQDISHRIHSMAIVHEKLYQAPDLSRLDFAAYTKSLLNYLWSSHTIEASGVKLIANLEQVHLTVDKAVPCGLILNELVINALKHAFKGRDSGQVIVTLARDGKYGAKLSVKDNGLGIPPNIDLRHASSLGLRLINMLAKQLHANLEITSDNGTEFSITFEERSNI